MTVDYTQETIGYIILRDSTNFMYVAFFYKKINRGTGTSNKLQERVRPVKLPVDAQLKADCHVYLIKETGEKATLCWGFAIRKQRKLVSGMEKHKTEPKLVPGSVAVVPP